MGYRFIFRRPLLSMVKAAVVVLCEKAIDSRTIDMFNLRKWDKLLFIVQLPAQNV